ncbi:FtsB family cell division protein [Oribacterium sp. HCP28S3_H8]|jgi:cell division protein FtsB|uniref:FtsB family cell division protein n=1 Tax=Oribacterium sp. HCP28S3_H8 TaxID=3438945 RepID=UPI0030742A4E|nr:septum formation initiator family protein [Oribacterium sp.]
MSERKKQRRGRLDNRAAMLGIIVVVLFLAIAVFFRGSTLRQQDREYQRQEESLDAAIADEQEHSRELEEKKVYVKTKEYVMEKAREIFGLKMPDEIIVRPEN